MKIKVIAVGDAEVKQSKNGKSYSMFELTFKNLDKNTTASKKLMSFDKKLYELFQASHSGDIYDIKLVKSDDDKFWNWSDATKGTEEVTGNGSEAPSSPRSTYKAFNDDSRQLTIIRQSTLKAAVDWGNAHEGLTLADVFTTAKLFQEYVLNPEFKLDTVTEPELHDEEGVI